MDIKCSRNLFPEPLPFFSYGCAEGRPFSLGRWAGFRMSLDACEGEKEEKPLHRVTSNGTSSEATAPSPPRERRS